MQQSDWMHLQEGDRIRHAGSGNAYTVLVGYRATEHGIVVARVLTAHNLDEWELIGRVAYPRTPVREQP